MNSCASSESGYKRDLRRHLVELLVRKRFRVLCLQWSRHGKQDGEQRTPVRFRTPEINAILPPLAHVTGAYITMNTCTSHRDLELPILPLARILGFAVQEKLRRVRRVRIAANAAK